MLLPFGCCLQAEVVHCVLDKPGFSAVTVQPIVHAVEHAAHVVRREGHIHHLLMVEGGTRVDAKLDKLPAEKAV